MNAIEIKNLHFSYGKENVLDGVSLCLKEGRRFSQEKTGQENRRF